MIVDGAQPVVPPLVMEAWFDAMPDPQVLLQCIRNSAGEVADFVYRDLNSAACREIDRTREDLRGRSVSAVMAHFGASGLLAAYTRCLETGDALELDDQPLTLYGEPRRYDIRAARVSADLLAISWRDVTDRFALTQRVAKSEGELHVARRRHAAADALFRRSVDSAAVGMGLLTIDGRFMKVNDAMCSFFGRDAAALRGKTLQELTADHDPATSAANIRDVLSGRIDSYRMTKQYIHGDGSLIWGHVSVGCVRADDGRVEVLIAQIVDITSEVSAREQLADQQARNQRLARQLTSEIRSAADYVMSTLPGELRDPVAVSWRYLPSLDLGGDSFNCVWLDADHLVVYLIDVSGHGIRAALLSMSVHNLIRSGSLPTRLLLQPGHLLARLNALFRMEDQDGHYFTIWYGVYQHSTGTLCYASAGHPPALAFTPHADGTWRCVALSTKCLPIGMFDQTQFAASAYPVPQGCRLLLFSDGAFELNLPGGRHGTLRDFTDLCLRLLDSDRFSVDTVVEELRSQASDGHLDDDCSLVLADFP